MIEVYDEQDLKEIEKTWKKFPFLDPNLPFLDREATKAAIRSVPRTTKDPRNPMASYTGFTDERGLLSFERVAVEWQIITAEDYRRKNSIPEAQHSEYRKRQFLKVFPALFPEQIYRPLVEARG